MQDCDITLESFLSVFSIFFNIFKFHNDFLRSLFWFFANLNDQIFCVRKSFFNGVKGISDGDRNVVPLICFQFLIQKVIRESKIYICITFRLKIWPVTYALQKEIATEPNNRASSSKHSSSWYKPLNIAIVLRLRLTVISLVLNIMQFSPVNFSQSWPWLLLFSLFHIWSVKTRAGCDPIYRMRLWITITGFRPFLIIR